MTEASVFFETNVAKQKEILEQRIQEAKNTGDPVIMLPFDTYPVVEAEMAVAGWAYSTYLDKDTGKKCARFCPRQYIDKK